MPAARPTEATQMEAMMSDLTRWSATVSNYDTGVCAEMDEDDGGDYYRRDDVDRAIAALQAENARLREALVAILGEYSEQTHGPILYSAISARAALEKPIP